MTWHSIQLHHHDQSEIDSLLLDGIRPVLQELAEQGIPGYFQRHWLRGPHVRIILSCSDSRWTAEVLPQLSEQLVAVAERFRSAGHPDQVGELAMHRRLADLEDEPGQLEPWLPDNSVQVEPFDARLHVLKTAAASDLLSRWHTASTPITWRLLDQQRSGAELSVPLLRLMLASAERGCPPISRGFLSYRSHAEGFLANTSDPAAQRARFDAAYRRNSAELRTLLDEVLAACPRPDAADLLADWVPLIDRFKVEVEELHRAGQLDLPRIPEVGAGLAPGVTVSAFHRSMFADDAVRDELSTAPWFLVYRVLLNYQYLLFSRLGLAPRQRFALCYLAARTVEDAYGIDRNDPASIGQLPGPAGARGVDETKAHAS